MGFYYSSGAPPEDDDPGGWREVAAMIVALVRVLALPLALLFGAVIGLIVVIWLFLLHPAFGLAALGVIAAAIVARGVWEAKHPPKLS